MAQDGTTIFMSTHTLKLAEVICDRIGVISGGNLIAVGTVAELQEAARLGEADLEQAFLELTRSQEDP
jgi:ABC-2 type transport system ATP-binding protein